MYGNLSVVFTKDKYTDEINFIKAFSEGDEIAHDECIEGLQKSLEEAAEEDITVESRTVQVHEANKRQDFIDTMLRVIATVAACQKWNVETPSLPYNAIVLLSLGGRNEDVMRICKDFLKQAQPLIEAKEKKS